MYLLMEYPSNLIGFMSTSDLVKSVWVDTLQNIPFGLCQQLVRRTALSPSASQIEEIFEG